MKKKLLTFLLAGAMALSCSAFVMAEETEFDLDELLSQMEDVEVTEETISGMAITWEDVQEILEADENLAKGGFVEDEVIGLKYYMPDFMEEAELTEEDEADGMIRYFWNGEDALFFIMEKETAEIEVTDAIGYLKVLEEAGEFDPMLVDVNGIDTVLYFIQPDDDETPEIMSLAYIPEEGDKMYEFFCSPGDVEGDYVDMFRVIIASIQKIEEE